MNLELNWIDEPLVDDLNYLCMHHKRCRPNDIDIWNLRACEGKSKTRHKLELELTKQLTSYKLN